MIPYKESIDGRNPTMFLFLIDQSGSMSKPLAGRSDLTKAKGVADAVNRLIFTLVSRSSRGHDFKEYYYMGLVGYSNEIRRGFGGALQDRHHVLVSEVGRNPLRVETRIKKTDDGAGGILEQRTSFPVWVEPVADGKTKMREALEVARETAAAFVSDFPASFPPIVINITDGVPTDATPPGFPEVEAAASALRQVANQNGSCVLLFNIHVSETSGQPILFANNEASLTDPYSRLLFRMSSPLTDDMCDTANALEMEMPRGARGFVYQGDLVSVIQLLDIGTRVGTNR